MVAKGFAYRNAVQQMISTVPPFARGGTWVGSWEPSPTIEYCHPDPLPDFLRRMCA